MTYQQLIRFYGGFMPTVAKLGLPKQTVQSWKDRGIPWLRQFYIEQVTDGKLKADRRGV